MGISEPYDEIVKFLKKNSDTSIVSRDDVTQRMVAVCLGGFDSRRGFIHKMAVDPEYQRKGFGRQMLNTIMEKFRKKGIVKVHLLLEKRNAQVGNFYQQIGWGKRGDIIVMSLPLRKQ